MEPPSTRRELVSISDYAARSGLSETEIRRQIRSGRIAAEKFERPQGTYYRVIVEAPEDTPAPATVTEAPPAQPATTEPPAAISGLLELIAADRETIQQQAAEIRALAERVGRSESERDRLQAELERERRPWWAKIFGGR